MIYVCVVAHDNAPTVGLLLWKIRQVFTADPREYQFLVVDDGSTDGTAELLEPYQRALPLTLFQHDTPRGFAASVDRLFREALQRTDRPKRDVALLVPADFAVSPEAIPEFLKRVDSGADLVVGERVAAPGSMMARLVWRSAALLLRPGVHVPGVRDPLSGFCAFRLMTLKRSLDERHGHLLDSDGIPARAELVARTAVEARQMATVPVPCRPAPAPAVPPLALALALYRAGRRVSVPSPSITFTNSGP